MATDIGGIAGVITQTHVFNPSEAILDVTDHKVTYAPARMEETLIAMGTCSHPLKITVDLLI